MSSALGVEWWIMPLLWLDENVRDSYNTIATAAVVLRVLKVMPYLMAANRPTSP